jgi:flagellar capping protein FliD
MKYIVEIIKKHEGFNVGEKKTLTHETASHLKKKGIAKILGEAPNAKEAIKKVDKASKAISEIDARQTARIEELETKLAALTEEVKKLTPKK